MTDPQSYTVERDGESPVVFLPPTKPTQDALIEPDKSIENADG